jgi:hypothetical protein
MPVIRIFLAVWALLQCMKLLPCDGISGTLAIAYCYLFTFAVFEILGICASFMLQDRAWREKALAIISRFNGSHEIPWAWWREPLLLFTWLVQFVWSGNVLIPFMEYILKPWKAYNEQHGEQWSSDLTGILTTFGLLFSFPLFIIILYQALLFASENWRFAYEGILLLEVRHGWEEDEARKASIAVTTMAFVALHALLFYLYVFDGTGTFKPDWTKHLP